MNQSPNRRDFLKTVAGAGALAATGSLPVNAAPKPSSPAEKVAHSLFESLNEEQRSAVAFPFDHPLRSKVDNNWQITKPRIGQFFNKDQQAMVEEIFRKIHSPEYAETIVKQETVSFEGCLKVIQVTADQIGLAPKLAVDTDALRVAEFSAPDGMVVIKCDRAAKQVTVSIK